MVMVNLPTAGVDYHVPFGGRKASSYGPREQGRRECAQEYHHVHGLNDEQFPLQRRAHLGEERRRATAGRATRWCPAAHPSVR
jgi:hypothetical protein